MKFPILSFEATLVAVIPWFMLVPLAASAADERKAPIDRFISASSVDKNGGSTLLDATEFAANRSVEVRLGKTGDAGFIFDTELLRATGAWTGAWPQDQTIDSYRVPIPMEALVYFGTQANTPGWSRGEDFTDPRTLPKGPHQSEVKPGEPFYAEIAFGPLPREWAKYRGLYRSGDRVVFAYTVGQAALLESPDLEIVDGQPLITRNLNVLTPGDASSLLVAGVRADTAPSIEDGKAVFMEDPKKPDERTVIGILGAPAGAALIAKGSHIILKLPPFAAGQKLKVVYAHGPASNAKKLAELIGTAAPPEDLQAFTHGGAAHWTQTVKTKGTLGPADGAFPYVVDDLAAPVENPYHSEIAIGGFDFFKDGRIAFCTLAGDVWIGKGIDDKLESIEWKRFASGLYIPLGLKIVDDQIHVLGRDQITRLHDLDGDGEADFYENFNNDVEVTSGRYETSNGLETDSKGNFYFSTSGPVNYHRYEVSSPLSDHHGCMFRVSGSGQKLEIFASGLGYSSGPGIGPNDDITTGDTWGAWRPASYLHYVKEGECIEVPYLSHRQPAPTSYATHLCWIPIDWDLSSGSQVWVTGDRWGPLQGMMLHLSGSNATLFGVLQEEVGDVHQGGVFQFPLKFTTGIRRARFNPTDGQLYVAGMASYGGGKVGAVQRVRYTGKPVMLPNALHVTNQGITIGFTGAFDLDSANKPGTYSVEQYNYRWTAAEKAADYKVSDPSQEGRDRLEIKSVLIAPDHKSVFLEIPGLKPVMQMRIKMHVKSAKGAPAPEEIANTINVVPKGEAPKWLNFNVGHQF